MASAPANPPRLPVTLVALDTKKVSAGPEGMVGLSSLHAAAIRITTGIRERLIIGFTCSERCQAVNRERFGDQRFTNHCLHGAVESRGQSRRRRIRLPVRADSRAASRISVTIMLLSSDERALGFRAPR